MPHLVPYSASKFALIGFSKGIRAELKKDGICVTTVVPGLMRTGSLRNVDTVGKHRLEYSWFMLSDSLPGVSMDARRAARKIIKACVAGQGEVTLGLPAKVIAKAEALAPNAFESLLAATNERILPAPEIGDGQKRKGFESETTWTNSFATKLTRKAERQNNQLPRESRASGPELREQVSVPQTLAATSGHPSTVGAEDARDTASAQTELALMSGTNGARQNVQGRQRAGSSATLSPEGKHKAVEKKTPGPGNALGPGVILFCG